MPLNDYFQEYGPISRRRATGGTAESIDFLEEPIIRPRPRPERPQRAERPERVERPERPQRRRAVPRRERNPENAAAEAPAAVEPRPVPRRHARRVPQQPFSLPRLLIKLALVCVAFLLILPFAVQLRYQGQAMPGVSVQGISVAETNQSVIGQGLTARYVAFLRQPLTLTYGDQTWRPTLAQLGVTFDPTQAAAVALEPGRRGDVLTRLREQWMLWHTGIDVAPRLVIDRQRLQDYLYSISAPLEQPPSDAALSLAGGRILGTPGAPGRQVLIDDTANDILLALQTLTPQEVALRTRLLEPSIDDAALVVAQEEAGEFLSSPLVLTRDEERWVWEADRLAELIEVSPVGEELRVAVNPQRLTEAVEGLAQIVDSGSVEPRLRFANGAVEVVQEGRQGWRLKQEDATQVISETLHVSSPTTRTLALPFEELYPQVTADKIGELGIVELVGEGRSSFAGSAQYRVTNIKAGAARMDGVLIPPDAEFSFNTQLGSVDAANGFVEGYAIIGNRTQLEWGGGVCQNSTTVFRAAFWAGVPITERYAHPFYISWYDRFAFGAYGDGAGMDATIYTGVNDLKFVNDTGHWLLMHSYVDEINQVLTVSLYGTRPDREVVLDGPYISNEVSPPGSPIYINDPNRPSGTVYQSDVARSGRDIVVYRSILENGAEVRRDTFFTRFKAWPNVFVRGTG
ncbi:MAG: VanW family protein [Chloroflexaceae bacterium]